MSQYQQREERRRRIGEAKDAFIKAASALTDLTQSDAIAFAVLEGAIGLMHLAAIDEDGSARRRAEGVLVRVQEERRESKREG